MSYGDDCDKSEAAEVDMVRSSSFRGKRLERPERPSLQRKTELMTLAMQTAEQLQGKVLPHEWRLFSSYVDSLMES